MSGEVIEPRSGLHQCECGNCAALRKVFQKECEISRMILSHQQEVSRDWVNLVMLTSALKAKLDVMRTALETGGDGPSALAKADAIEPEKLS